MTIGLDQIDAATGAAARLITRRRFLTRAGQAIFFVGVTGVMLGTRFTEIASAHGNCNSPCGPSPLCPGSGCSGSTGLCVQKYRNYEGSTCQSGASGTSWTEDYCGSTGCNWAGTLLRCRDCCHGTPTGSNCNGTCDGHKHKCICRTTVITC